MADKACSDTGPILHLHEISQSQLLKVFSKIFISGLINEELLKYKIEKLPRNIELKPVNNGQVALLAEKFALSTAEASALWMCECLKVPILLTDDLDARQAAIDMGIKPVGTIGIIIRCFREKIINEKEAVQILEGIYKNSSLFLTRSLIKYAISEIRRFRKK